MEIPKPCPFCGCSLKKEETHYKFRATYSDEEFYEFARYIRYDHPKNDCILAPYSIDESQIKDWNRRENNEPT